MQPNSLNNKTRTRSSKRKSRTRSVQSMDNLLKNLLDDFESNSVNISSTLNLQQMGNKNLSKSVCDVHASSNEPEVDRKTQEELAHESIYTFMNSLPIPPTKPIKYSTLPRFPIKEISSNVSRPINDLFDNRHMLMQEDESCYEEVNLPDLTLFPPPLPDLPSKMSCSSSSLTCNTMNFPKFSTMQSKKKLSKENFLNKSEIYAKSCIKITSKAIDKMLNYKKKETVYDEFFSSDENEHEQKSLYNEERSRKNSSVASMTSLLSNKISQNHAVRARTLSSISSLGQNSFEGSKSELSVFSRTSSFNLNSLPVSNSVDSSKIYNTSLLSSDQLITHSKSLGMPYRKQCKTNYFF